MNRQMMIDAVGTILYGTIGCHLGFHMMCEAKTPLPSQGRFYQALLAHGRVRLSHTKKSGWFDDAAAKHTRNYTSKHITKSHMKATVYDIIPMKSMNFSNFNFNIFFLCPLTQKPLQAPMLEQALFDPVSEVKREAAKTFGVMEQVPWLRSWDLMGI